METKDIIIIVLGVFTVISGFLTYHIYRKLHKLEKEKFQYQKEMDKKKEQDEKTRGTQQKLNQSFQKGTDAERYCDHVAGKYKYLDFTGLNAILQKPLLLEKIYVRLRAKKSFARIDYRSIDDFNALEAERSYNKEKEEKIDTDFITVFKNLHIEYEQKREPIKMIILGHPGSGKTTLMKWIALQCACGPLEVFSSFIPVFIPLKDFGRDPEHTFKNYNILDLTVSMLEKETVSASFIRDKFDSGNLLFLLDGLDEIGDETLRREAIEWIEKQNIRLNALLVTSRFSGLQESKGLKFHDAYPVFSILDFNIEDIQLFLENWYRIIETAVAGDVGEKEKEDALNAGETKFHDLMNVIQNGAHKNLHKLAVNPLLLTIIAIVHRTRAVLPKERHKLYEECLKVMIELWNVANRKLNVSFSVENSMHNLAGIAVFLMKENRREITLPEIENLLPELIEEQPRMRFLKEMVVKAGLLYESEGKFGFLHLTFQEYLAAWYFARSKNPLDILEYRGHDYWGETFKLFVNIGNAEQFFTEIIEHLEEKEYLENMNLWESCLWDMVVKETQGKMEQQFAHKVLEILPCISYNEANEKKINQLFAHYPIYKYAGEMAEKGWDLFQHAIHPFIQSVGSSILFRAGGTEKDNLIANIKRQILEFDKVENPTNDHCLEFLFRHNNSFVFLIAGTRNLRDFAFTIEKMKSNNIILVFCDLYDFSDLGDLSDLSHLCDLCYLSTLSDYQELRYRADLRDLRYLRDLSNLSYLHDLCNLSYLRDLNFLSHFNHLHYLCDQYNNKYKSIIREHKKELEGWADKKLKELHSKSDKKLLNDFPNTTPDELAQFRAGDY